MAKGQVIRKRFGKLIRGAKQMAGAGDMSDAPRYQKGRRAGAKPPSGIPPKESAKLARKKQQIGRAKVRARGGKKALQIEWDDLIPSAKRAEKKKFMEGKETPFDSIIKKMKKDTRKPVELVSQKEANEAAMKEAEKTLGLKGGGMTRQGLYPAEMARAGTMSQARRKRYMKKGGSISYKMTGGQVVSHGYD